MLHVGPGGSGTTADENPAGWAAALDPPSEGRSHCISGTNKPAFSKDRTPGLALGAPRLRPQVSACPAARVYEDTSINICHQNTLLHLGRSLRYSNSEGGTNLHGRNSSASNASLLRVSSLVVVPVIILITIGVAVPDPA